MLRTDPMSAARVTSSRESFDACDCPSPTECSIAPNWFVHFSESARAIPKASAVVFDQPLM